MKDKGSWISLLPYDGRIALRKNKPKKGTNWNTAIQLIKPVVFLVTLVVALWLIRVITW